MILFLYFFILGLATGLLFPPFFLIPLGFLIYPLIFFLINTNIYRSKTLVYHFFAGFIYGLGVLSVILIWIQEPFLVDVSTEKYSYISFLLIFYCSFFFGLVFLLLRFFRKMISKLIIFPALIVFGEFILSNLSYGFPCISYSLIHSGNNFGINIIYYIGTYGLSYLTILIFLLPSIFIILQTVSNKFYYKIL